MKKRALVALAWSAAIVVLLDLLALYVAVAPDPDYDPVLDNDGYIKGAAYFILSSPVLFLALALVIFVAGVAVRLVLRRPLGA